MRGSSGGQFSIKRDWANASSGAQCVDAVQHTELNIASIACGT